MKENRPIHPSIKELQLDVERGRLSRREFLRYASLLGISAVAASQRIGLGWPKKAAAETIQRDGNAATDRGDSIRGNSYH